MTLVRDLPSKCRGKGPNCQGGGWWGLKAAEMKLASKSTRLSDFLGREGGRVQRGELLWPTLPYPGPADTNLLFSSALYCL